MEQPSTFPAQALFEPRSVALVGVPREPRPGQLFLRALLDPGYGGRIYPVNPNAQEILGLPCYPSLAALPEVVDLAIVAVPAEAAVPVVEDCARRGVKAAILFTAGFSELGTQDGRDREARLLAAARSGGLRLLGPNCMGVYVPKSGLGSFPGMPSDVGPISFVSQSGSLGNRVVWTGSERGLAFSKVISVGNQADLETSDFLEYLANDSETEIIAAYIEGAKDGRRLHRALSEAGSRKHLVVWKVGRTPAGARAASSHTGALAGEAQVWAGLLRQARALQVCDLDELIDTLLALRFMGRSTRCRMAIVTGPGGPAVSAADACEEAGLTLAELSPHTQERLRGIIAGAGTSVRNPVDIGLVIAGAPELYRRALEATILDPGVDAVVVIGGTTRGQDWEAHVEAMRDLSRRAAKPILQVSFGPGDLVLDRAMARLGIPTFPSAERALRACARVLRRDD